MKTQIERGVLYVVATPIGNLQDITLRALDALKQAEVIFAEDTRITRKLLEQYAITPPVIISCHEHNEQARIALLIRYLNEQKITLLVSDAGTPLISDPGFHLVKNLRDHGYPVVPLPGVSALITALSAAGIATDNFQFKGFLPAKSGARKKILQSIQNTTMTTAFYESTHRIIDTLTDIQSTLPNHTLVVAKELTKKFERFFHGRASDILSDFTKDSSLTKGEFVILIEGINADNKDDTIIDEHKLLNLLLAELPIKKAVSIAVELTQRKKNALYKQALIIQEDKENKQSNSNNTSGI
ncbi:16S rRNA (cytidine(1402)-2'-O)-methyltransferase [Cysteiniphilum halobium]|uniref:16S rRNA (cytidine(1402)-2'-O)-methyltransferase n=1 Tax=Cysteiniphilum halobium TaxID=2219059 RepID=UPI003F833843